MRNEFSVKQERKEDKPNVKLCVPCNVNGFALTPTVIQNTIGEIEEPGLCNETEEEEDETIYIDEPEDEEEPREDSVAIELEAAKRRIKELEQRLLETRERLLEKMAFDAEIALAGKEEEQPEDPEPVEQEEPEEPQEEKPAELPDKYEPGSVPKLHVHIERMLEKGQHGDAFDNPLRHWPEKDARNILWVNIRLRCMLASLVKMSNFSHVDKESFAMLTNGFISLYNSPAFQSLPANYPYTNLFIELTDWLRESVARHEAKDDIKVILTVRRKALIVAICHELADNTEIVKFSELKFEPLQSEKKAKAQTPEWRRTDEEIHRKRRREIEQWKQQHKTAA